MKGGLGWIRGLKGQEQDMSSLALEGNHFSSWASEANPTLCCSIEISHDILYKTYYMSQSGIWRIISRVASYFHEAKPSANTAFD